MDFPEAVKSVLIEKYATFSGRSAQSEYWWHVLFQVVVLTVFNTLNAFTGLSEAIIGSARTGSFVLPASAWIVIGAYCIFFLACLLPSLAVLVRRLHDRNISGLWLLGVFVVIIPFIGPFIFLIGAIVLLVNLILDGTVGPNRFGPDPAHLNASVGVFR